MHVVDPLGHSMGTCIHTDSSVGTLHAAMLLQLRHPNVLAFRDSMEVQEKGATVVYLVTQPVKPLKLVLEELNLAGQHR